MTGLTFAEPQFVHGLWIVAVLGALLVGLELRRTHLLDRFVAPAMQSRGVDQPGDWRRALRIGLLVLSMLAIVIALMRPQWGFEFIEAPQVGAEIMVALDVSRSMLAEDVAPNRLERAKAELRDLLPYLSGDQVGLIAFAGRASVLCPLTPDFGFLRLVLDNVDVGSVSPGGTRLEEPIRKATAGFGNSGDLSRVILLFTDGEDHDSFPLDAAREAAERGIRIIIIGFGDENGSEIFVTDPQTGARNRVVDSGGSPVISRLDGDLLRDLALETQGAYVPAGTGVLDLESIFEAHIRPLMRGTGEKRGRTVQKDGFQWALLLALLALVASPLAQVRRRTSLGLLLFGLALGAPPEGWAQGADALAPMNEEEMTAEQEMMAQEEMMAGEELLSGDASADSMVRERISVPEQPREAYNRGLSSLGADELEESDRLFESARQDAGSDGELRYRATFNLGWVEIAKADASMEEAPEASLANLERAADWFREAIALRPGDSAPRRNLEIVLRRALILSDALAQGEGPDLATRLDALIEEQRGATTTIRGVVESLAQAPQAHLGERSKALFKNAGLSERQILSSATGLSQAAGDELKSLQNSSDAELSPEQRMRGAQLEALLGYLHLAQERMGQARSQLRRKQAVRAHRRAAVGLSHLKRAREQLQNPVEVLDGLVGDASRVAVETRTLAAASASLPLGVAGANPGSAGHPAWLDAEYLAESQDEVAQRSAELEAKLRAGLESGPAPEEPEQALFLERLRAAQPHIARATEALVEGGLALREERLIEAGQRQVSAVDALAEAREQFLDLKGLIDVAHTDESRIAGVLDPQEAPSQDDLREFAPTLGALQTRNLERVQRMARMVEQMHRELDGATPPGEGSDASGQDPEAERQRLKLAEGILALTESSMTGASESLVRLAQEASAREEAWQGVSSAIDGLSALQRIFFTLIEHLRDAGRQQLQLGDETEIAPGLGDEESGPEAQRLASQQQSLAEFTESLATALHEQSFAEPAQLVGPEAATDPAAVEAATEKLVKASEFVLAAADAMLAAAAGMDESAAGEEPSEAEGSADEAAAVDEARAPGATGAESTGLDRGEIRELQDVAVHNIQEALATLEPPGEEPQQGDEEQGDSQPQEQQQPGDGESEPEESEADSDPGQLLQSVRDREAERHRQKRERNASGYAPVDKDW